MGAIQHFFGNSLLGIIFILAFTVTSQNIDIQSLIMVLFITIQARLWNSGISNEKFMEPVSDLVGNPTTLLIERFVYLSIGLFLLAALYTGIKRGGQD